MEWFLLDLQQMRKLQSWLLLALLTIGLQLQSSAFTRLQVPHSHKATELKSSDPFTPAFGNQEFLEEETEEDFGFHSPCTFTGTYTFTGSNAESHFQRVSERSGISYCNLRLHLQYRVLVI